MGDEQTTTHVCIEKECGRDFEMTESDTKFFTDKGLYTPKRCKGCRQRRKNEKAKENME